MMKWVLVFLYIPRRPASMLVVTGAASNLQRSIHAANPLSRLVLHFLNLQEESAATTYTLKESLPKIMGFAAEIFSSVVVAELVNRCMSFLFAKCENKQATATVQEDLQLLRRLLMRGDTIVEEAERRHVANRDMLRQLSALRDAAYRGYYVLDTVRCRALPRGGGGGGSHSNEEEEEVNRRRAFALSRCMFGRNMERERIVEFLLQTEPPPGAGNLGVLPIVGPAHIGKSTLVEHVCHDVKVCSHFSLIMVFSGNELKDETAASFRDKCVIKHQNDQASKGRVLIVVELLEDVDEEAWKRLYSSERSMSQGSKMIITSRSDKIVRFGTTQALRLKCLPIEAYWYLFRTAAFGSDDPGQHPKMVSLALEMAILMQGSFMFAYMGAALLNTNFNTQSWSRILTRVRQYFQKNASLIGEYPDDIKVKDYPRYTWNVIKEKPDKYFMLHDIYQRDSGQEVPDISFLDLQAGRAQPPPGKYEILFMRSPIPPYFNYICACEIRDM
ncbi:disease resistance protein RGA2-like isoform X4 [Panicum hallii]|uniref:disease resistance protein RGA2-like isoform X4 n=1 Tax=Panicum hallii TaxID=206008 RepID=UPI000DF4D5D6|nr:disease resistance protein RGA2-like isoform X4 [Panicum hallii]